MPTVSLVFPSEFSAYAFTRDDEAMRSVICRGVKSVPVTKECVTRSSAKYKVGKDITVVVPITDFPRSIIAATKPDYVAFVRTKGVPTGFNDATSVTSNVCDINGNPLSLANRSLAIDKGDCLLDVIIRLSSR